MDVEGCNDGATPQERQTEAQQQNGNGCNDGTTPQEQQMEAQQQNRNDCNDGTTLVEFWGLQPLIIFFNMSAGWFGGLFCQLDVTEQGSLVTGI